MVFYEGTAHVMRYRSLASIDLMLYVDQKGICGLLGYNRKNQPYSNFRRTRLVFMINYCY